MEAKGVYGSWGSNDMSTMGQTGLIGFGFHGRI